MAYVPEFPMHTEVFHRHVLDLDQYPPRIVAMLLTIVQHQQVLNAYATGQLSLNWNGPHVRPQLEKVSLSSQPPSY